MKSDASLTSNQELPRDLETKDETTPPSSSSGVLEHILLTRNKAEDLKTKLLLCNDQSFTDCLEFGLGHLPCYRTSHVFTSPSALAALHTSTETEESFGEGNVNTKEDEKLKCSAISTGYFPCYRTHEKLLGQPLSNGLNTERKKPDNSEKDESEDVEMTAPSCLEFDNSAVRSTTDKEPPAHQLTRDSTSGDHLSMTSSPSAPSVLNQPFPSSEDFSRSRTEGELCIGPTLENKFSTGIECLENKEGGQRGQTGIWSLLDCCLMC